MIECQKINTDMVVAGGLIIGLLAAIFMGMNELAMSIASGLVDYMGRSLAEHKGGVDNGKAV